jgi:5'(3')-deoxyribonucleotidase
VNNMVVGLDVDGVLAGFVERWLEYANEVAGTAYTAADATDYNFRNLDLPDRARDYAWGSVAEPGACAALDVLPGAVAGVRQLERDAHTVLFVTSPLASSPTWAHEREGWLRTHFGVDRARVVHAHDKTAVGVDVLVDDYLNNVHAFTRSRGNAYVSGIVWDRPWNQPRAPRPCRVCGWDELAALLRSAC